jgi:ABC-type multidrug transport system fused ATPase/permease subunit
LRLNAFSGQVLVDGIDIQVLSESVFIYMIHLAPQALHTHTLRRKIATIPQEPFLLSGSLRCNLDPMGECLDSTLLEAVRVCGLEDLDSAGRSSFEREPRAILETEVKDRGRQLSVGQRQVRYRAIGVHTYGNLGGSLFA